MCINIHVQCIHIIAYDVGPVFLVVHHAAADDRFPNNYTNDNSTINGRRFNTTTHASVWHIHASVLYTVCTSACACVCIDLHSFLPQRAFFILYYGYKYLSLRSLSLTPLLRLLHARKSSRRRESKNTNACKIKIMINMNCRIGYIR